MTIYRTYPLHLPGKTDEAYFAWLREQEPVVIGVDPRALPAKADWIGWGRAVFDWPSNITPKQGSIASRVVIRTKGQIEFGILSCSGCPVGPSALLEEDSTGDRRDTGNPAKQPWRDQGAPWLAPWLKPDPNALPEDLATFARLRTRIPSVAARFHSSSWAPANMPSLIGVRDIKYLDRTGLVQHRSIGDLMRYAALNFGGGAMSNTSAFGADAPGRPVGPNLRRLSDGHLYALALYVYSLEPPANPNRVDQRAAAGQKIFESKGCATCHTPPLYTNNKLAPAPGFRVPDEHKTKYDIMPVSAGTDPWLATKTRRGTGYYKVPSLRGVWYRGPFEHNGSVLTLEDWFDASRLRDDYVPTGWLGPNETRAVRGHEFGLRLKPEEKASLIAFLKTL